MIASSLSPSPDSIVFSDPNIICVLLSTYQGEKFIAAQLDSILAQRGVRVGVVIRDDGSSDGTVSILRGYQARYPQQILLLLDERRLGVKKSFETLLAWALDHTGAEYFCFSDQDDLWLPQKISTLVEALGRAAGSLSGATPVLVHSDLIVVDEELNEISHSFWQGAGINPHRNRLNELVFSNTVTGCASLFNRALARVALPIPDRALMHDHWIGLCARLAGQIVVVDQALVRYRQHAHNVVGAVRADKRPFFSRILRLIQEGPTPKPWGRVVPQAQALLDLHGPKMSDASRQLLESFVQLPRMGPLKRRWFLVRYRFAPGTLGWLRRLSFWIFA